MWKRAITPVVLSMLMFATAATAQERAAGEWQGEISLPGTALRVEVRLSNAADGWTGTIDIPQQNAQGMPLGNIRIAGDSAIFSIQGVPGNPTFLGVMNAAGDTLAGAFAQSGGRFPFTLVRAGSQATTDPFEGFDAVVRKSLADFVVPGVAIAVVRDGRVIYSEGFGYRDVARRLPVTPSTIFAIGSSTKAFTTFALGVLADSGRFDWDTPVRDYIPELRLHDEFAGDHVTTRDMVTHRTGLPRHDLVWYTNTSLSPDSLLRLMRYFEPTREIREAWQYNNLMFVMAGNVLSRLTGRTWEDAVRALVLEPLGMRRSNFNVHASQADPDHALPYREAGDTLVRMQFRDISHVGAAGSINSTIEEMTNWMRVHLELGRFDGRQIVRPATLREMHTPQMAIPALSPDPAMSPTSYALGWMTQTYRGHYRVFHGGNIDGFSALVTLFPMDRTGIVVLTNMNGTPLPELLTRHAADRVFELEHRDWLGEAFRNRSAARQAQSAATERLDEQRVKDTRPSLPLTAYAGEYEHPGYGRLHLSVAGDRLHIRFHEVEAPFEHWHFDVFSGLENPADPVLKGMKVQFRMDIHGGVSEALVAMEPMLPAITFARLGDERLRDPEFLQKLVGQYAIDGGGTAAITRTGTTLYLEVPGQPPYRMEPGRDLTFRFEDLEGYRVRFHLDAAGNVERMEMLQPNGVFIARPTGGRS